MTDTPQRPEERDLVRRYNSEEMLKQSNAMNAEYIVVVPQPAARGIRGFFQRLIRKLTGFLLKGITEQQTRFNADTVRTINQVTQYIWDAEEEAREGKAAFDSYSDAIRQDISSVEQKLYDKTAAQHEYAREIFDSTDVRMERMMTKILLLEEEVRQLKQQLKEKEDA